MVRAIRAEREELSSQRFNVTKAVESLEEALPGEYCETFGVPIPEPPRRHKQDATALARQWMLDLHERNLWHIFWEFGTRLQPFQNTSRRDVLVAKAARLAERLKIGVEPW